MSFTFENIYSLIESLPESETITLIGGQALNFWAELYFHDNSEFYSQYGPFTSMDIDFFGGKDIIVESSQIWGGLAKFAKPFETSPNIGIVVVPLKSGENIIIDFLSSVHGLSNTEILKHRIKVHYKNAKFYVLHPLHCLKSRISNAIGLHRNNTDSLKRIEIAVAVVKKRIIHLLEAERKREALDETELVFRIACNSMLGISIFTDYNLDIFEAVPKDSRFGDMFIVRRYPQMKNHLDSIRNKKKISNSVIGVSHE